MHFSANPSRQETAIWRQLDASLLWIYEGLVPSFGSSSKIKNAEFFSLWLIEDGFVELRYLDGMHYKVSSNNWVALTPESKKSQIFSDGARILSFSFSAHWPGLKHLFQEKNPIISERSMNKELEIDSRKLLDYVSSNLSSEYLKQQTAMIDFHVYAEMNVLFWKMLGEWYRFMLKHDCEPQIESYIDPRLKTALGILKKHNFNHPLPYNRLCRDSGLSRSHFDRLFLQELKISPKKFCERVSLENAVKHLSSRSMSIKEIAYDLGFVNLPHFCTWFKRKTERTPKEYRAQLI